MSFYPKKLGTLLWLALLVGAAVVEPVLAESETDLEQLLADRVESILTDYKTEALSEEEALGEIEDLQQALLAPLVANLDAADPEVSARVATAVEELTLEARIQRVFSRLSPPQREKLMRFRQVKHDEFNNVFSRDVQNRIAAVKAIDKWEDRQALAEPLLIMCLRHPEPALADAAARAGWDDEYTSEAYIDELTRLYRRARRWSENRSHYSIGTGDEQVDPARSALLSLQNLKAKRAAGPLVHLLIEDSDPDHALAHTLIKTGNLRVVPTLLKHLDDMANNRDTYTFDNTRIDVSACDVGLYVCLKMTGQSLNDYDLLVTDYYGRQLIGFRNEEKRHEAMKKFRKWWEKAFKTDGRYHGLKPLEPDLPLRMDRPRLATVVDRAQPDTRPAETQPTSGPAAKDVQPALKEAAGALVEDFGARRYRTRRGAAKKMLALEQALLSPLVSAADRFEDKRRSLAMEGLSRAVIQSRTACSMVPVDAETRRLYREFAGKHPEVYRKLFSLRSQAALVAVDELARRTDTPGAEPLLLMMMDHGSRIVSRRAVEVLVERSLNSDATRDALLEIVKSASDRDWREVTRAYREPSGLNLALKGLSRFKSDEVTAVFAGVMCRDRYDVNLSYFVADLLVKRKDLRVIPHMMNLLEKSDERSTWSTGQLKLSFAPSDPALYALTKLTGQKPEEHGLTAWPSHGRDVQVYGMKSKKDRQAGVEKFREWWDKHKTDEKYKGLKPLELPAMEQEVQTNR
ncbi:MAG: hypothetical protein ACLFVU_05980 [Phycisphaerae bacterium]